MRWILLLISLTACRATPAAETAPIEAVIDELYAAFGFDPRAEPDWATQRRIYLEGATFAGPIQAGRPALAQGTEEFLEGFREFVLAGPYSGSGLHERILAVRVDRFGGIAHAYVAFEGFAPGDPQALTRGLDSLQFVLDRGDWKLLSFSTQYEGGGLVIPARFLR